MTDNTNPALKSQQMRDMMLGLDSPVELYNGDKAPAINLDNAATTPPFKEVAEEVHNQLMYYGSVGRGKGQKSDHSSRVYSYGREAVMKFIGANISKYTVFYANCTTDGMNKLSSALIESSEDNVLTTRMEHHANDLPWRERTKKVNAKTVYAEVDSKGRLKLEDIKRLLDEYNGKIKYVAVSAASNVTGYVNEVHIIAKMAHAKGAQIIVDGAQIVAHREFSMLGKTEDEDIDFFVFSAHKMYSPYGGGAVIGLKDVLNSHMPQFYGGGMVEAVYDDEVEYSDAPDLYEAGSPNYAGVVGMLKAIKILSKIGFDYIKEHEQKLLKYAIDGLEAIDGIILYGDGKIIADRVGILVFNIIGVDNDKVADMLAGMRGIAVRHAKFCAHTYVKRLIDASIKQESDVIACPPPNGMVRVSFGIYNTTEDVDAFIETVKLIISGTDKSAMFRMGLDTAFASRETYMPNDRG